MMIDKRKKTIYSEDNAMSAIEMDTTPETAMIEIDIVEEITDMVLQNLVQSIEEVEVEKSIIIVDLLAITLDQEVPQVERATEGEEAIVGTMTEEGTIERIKIGIPTIIPETIDYLMKERLVNLYTTLYKCLRMQILSSPNDYYC